MSKVIEERVLEMQFDNRHFERNVSTTMSTLDKLKRSLNLSGASKGLENVNAAAKNTNLSGLGSAVETVRSKFSALEVMGVTALANITNSAVNAGKRIVSALTIQPVTTGFNEYELKMTSLRTIMASTGEELETVSKYLNELNEYSDQTIYSFSDMTQNIGKFTNAGVKLEDAVAAIKGISNEAAVSGASANEASRAMYNFAQALSAGYVKLIDWKSIELANMATVEFKEQLLQAAVAGGTLTKTADGMYETLEGSLLNATTNFNESLQDQWMTTEVLIGTLKNYADETTEIGKKAKEAATKVRTWTQLFDTLKESAQSGWAQTWELVVGDYYEAEDLFGGISKAVGGFIDGMSKARNSLIGDALNSKWEQLADKIEAAGLSADDYLSAVESIAKENGIAIDDLIKKYGSLKDAIKAGKIPANILTKALKKLLGIEDKLDKSTGKVTKTLEEYQKIVDKVIRGDFGNGQERIEKLTAAGYDWAKVQNMVNEKLGSSVRHVSELTDEQLKNADSLAAMSDEQLKAKGLTDEQIIALRDLKKAAEEGGTSINELMKDMEKPSGRELLLDSLKNVAEAIVKPLRAVRDAWKETFPAITGDDIYRVIEGLNELTESLIISDKTAENFKKVFEGLFAGFQIGNMLITKSITATVKILDAVLGLFDTDIVGLAAHIAEYVIMARDWIKENTIFIGHFDKIAAVVVEVISGIQRCIKAFLELTPVQKIIEKVANAVGGFFGKIGAGFDGLKIGNVAEKIKEFFDNIEKWIKGLENTENLGKDIIDGLINGLKAGVSRVTSAIVEVAKSLYTAFCDFFGIASPSKLFITLGGFLIAGLIVGIANAKNGVLATLRELAVNCFNSIKGWFGEATTNTGNFLSNLFGAIKKGLGKVTGFFEGLNWGSLIAAGFGVGMLVLAYKIVDVAKMLVSPLGALEGLLKAAKNAIDNIGKSISKYYKAKAFDKISDGVLNMAIAVGILAASVWVLSKIPSEDIWRSVGAVAALVVVVAAFAGLSALLAKVGGAKLESLSLVAMAGAVLIMAGALEKLSKINVNSIPATLDLLGGIVVSMVAMMLAFGMLSKVNDGMHIHKVGVMLLGMAVAMRIIVGVIDIAGKMELGTIKRGLAVIGVVGLLFAALIVVSKLAGEHASKAATMLLKMSIAFLAMVAVIKIASWLDKGTVVRGLAVIAAVGLLFAALIATSHLAGKNATKAGVMILMMSAALLLVIHFVKQAARLDESEIAKGIVAMAAVGLLFAALIKVAKNSGKNAARVGVMLLGASGALLILTGVIFLMGKIPIDVLKQGLVAVSLLMGFMIGLVAVTKLTGKAKTGTLIVLAVAIGILALAATGLSFIPVERLKPAIAGLSLLLVAFGLVVAATKFAKNTKDMRKTLLIMIGVIAALGLVVWGLSLFDATNAVPNALAVAILMTTLAGAMFIMSKAGRMSTTVSKQILPMIGVVAALGLVVAGLSFMDPQKAIPNTIALAGLLLAYSAVMVILSKTSKLSAGIGSKLFIMVGITALLGLIVAGLSFIPNPDTAIKMTATLIPLLLAFTAVTAILSLLGKGANSVTAAAKGAASLSIVVGIVGALVVLIGSLVGLISDDWMSTIENGLDRFVGMMEKMAVLLLAFIPVTAALGLVGKFIGPGAAAMGALALVAVIGILGAVAVALGSLMSLLTDEFFTKIETGLDRFTSVMIKLGEAIGGFVGGILGGIAEGALAAIGQGLSDFMNNAQDFIDGCREIDESVLKGAGILAAAIIAITVADLINSFADLLEFGPSLPNLGEDLSEFMDGASGFIEGASKIDPSAMEGMKTLAEAILVLTAANVLDGLSRFFSFGESSLATFGEQLPSLGTNLASFASNLGTFSEAQVTTVTCAANAIKALADAAKDIPNEGGWAAKILGDNSIATFGSYLPDLGTNLSKFVTNLGTFTEDQVATVGCAGDAISELAKAAQDIPNEGGWAAKILGDNSIATFGSYLPALGTNLSDFATNLGTFTEDQVTTVGCAGDAISALAKAAQDIPNEGGWAAKILGDNSIATFGSYLPELGTNLSDFVANLGTFTKDQVSTVGCAGDAISELAKAANGIDGQADWAKKIFGDNSIAAFGEQLPGLGTDLASFVENLGTFSSEQLETVSMGVKAIGAFADLAGTDLKTAKGQLEGFGEKMVAFATDLSTFCTKMPGSETSATAVANLNTIVTAVKGISADGAGSISSFGEALKKLGTDGVTKFVNALTSSTAKTDVKEAAKKLADQAVDGIETKQKSFKEACDNLADKGSSAIKTKANHDDFKSAGKYLGDGLVEGINSKKSDVYWAAYALGQAAVQGEKDGQASQSPSKLTIQAGKWLGEGLVIGMERMLNQVYESGSSLGEAATNVVSKSISRIADVVNTDIDTQPTIRPVLDLSNVRTGVNAIDGMFGMNPSIGVLANVRSISSMMNQKSQNGTNSDVVSAINRLGKSLSTSGGDTYNFGDFTYDDGSNISDAVKTLIRAARIERRV